MAAAFMAAACAEIENGTNDGAEGFREYIDVCIEPQTKVGIGSETSGKLPLLWNEGDRISVVDGSKSSVYELYEGAGTRNARFKYVSGDAKPDIITKVVYPATASGTVPATQTYKAGTFDPDAAYLVYDNPAATKESAIVLQSETSYLCFQLTGSDKINTIEVRIESGNASGSTGGITYQLVVPSAQLSATASPFYMVIPAMDDVRANVTFTSSSGTMTKIIDNKTFKSGQIHRFAKTGFKADKTFRIMTYNVGQCDKSTSSSPEFIANIVKELKADAAVMNEVKSSIFGGYQDKEISEKLGWNKFYREAQNNLGNMVTYNPDKLVGKSESYLSLPNIASEGTYNENRVAVFVEFDDFVMVGTHLEKDDFAAHAKAITEEVAAKYSGTDKPVVLCGDMNTRPYFSEMLEFEKNWTLLSKENQATLYNPEQPDNLICIDYIFAWKGGAPCQVIQSEICKSVACGTITDASDHFPVWADVKVGYSSLPLEDTDTIGDYEIVDETAW